MPRSASPKHRRGTRNLGSGSRSLTPPRQTARGVTCTVHTSVEGKAVATTLRVNRPFGDGLILIAGQKRGRIRRGNVLVRSRTLATKLQVEEAYVVFTGLRDAIRAFDVHAKDGYLAEAGLLGVLTARRLPEAMLRTLDQAGIGERGKKEWAAYIGGMAANLKHDRDEGKVVAREKLLRASDIHDSLGRPNPSATRARVMAGLSRLRDREEEVPTRDAHRAKIAAQLKVIGLRASAMVLNLEQEVARAIRRVNEAHQGEETDLDALALCLENESRHFAAKDVNPYGPHAFKHYAKDCDLAAAALRAGRLKQASHRLDILARALLLARERSTIDAALTCVARAKRTGQFAQEERQAMHEIVKSVGDFLSVNLEIDKGFRRPVASDLRSHVALAIEQIDKGDAARAYEHLEAAARCI